MKIFYASYFILIYFVNLTISCFIYIFQFTFLICFYQKRLYTYWYCSILVIKSKIFNISIDSSLNIFLYSWPLLLWTMESFFLMFFLMFFLSIWYFRVFRFSIFIANITIDFHYLSVFRFYWEYFNIYLSFFLYWLGENKFVFSNKLLSFNIKSINPTQK